MGVTAPTVLVKQPSEKRNYSMDFSNLMSTEEAITGTPTVTSARRGGGGASDLTIETITVVGQTVTFWISGGTHAEVYRVEVVVTTDSDQILEGDGLLRIEDK